MVEGTSDKHDRPNFVGVLYQKGKDYALTSSRGGVSEEESEEEEDEDAREEVGRKTKVFVRRRQEAKDGQSSTASITSSKAFDQERQASVNGQKFTLLYPFFKYDNALSRDREQAPAAQ